MSPLKRPSERERERVLVFHCLYKHEKKNNNKNTESEKRGYLQEIQVRLKTIDPDLE